MIGDERPLLRIVRGTPSDEELAALTAVVTAAARATTSTPPRRRSAWGDPAARLRTRLDPGPGAWRASALPR